ncbi:OTU domain-containing protein [Mycena sanguinolenta]|uniref:OTU domain-containing protein n=1 Tax=Mycena sanguinolenta TaxID=230812 RepID=A0A8H6Z5V8_9AGAR|nr:OTU domain-containing protein [Mycena sanguinolenta]
MAGSSTARPAPPTDAFAPAPPRSVSTADSSTRNGDDDEEGEELDEVEDGEELPTSFEATDDHDEEVEEDDHETSTARGEHDAHEDQRRANGHGDGDEAEHGEHEYADQHTPRPWYNPSLSVLFALAPPIGNWLTGGDHLKDFLLLALLVWYLHQLVEIPWSLYHAARPRVHRHSPLVHGPPNRRAARAVAALRTTELLLLALCVAAPVLGVTLLRSLASFSSPRGANGGTSVFALVTAIRPLRELVSRISSRTSTLHSIVHAHTSLSQQSTSASTELAELKEKISRLEAAVKELAGERRSGLCKGKEKEAASTSQGESGTACKTIFVPAPPKPRAPSSLSIITSWFASLPPAPLDPAPAPPPISPSGANGRRALDSIPEEGELFVFPPAASTSKSNSTPTIVHMQQRRHHPGVVELFRAWLAAGLALALYPLYFVLRPVQRLVGA